MKIEDLELFDAAEYLDSDETIAEYLVLAFETGEQALIRDAIGAAARAKGMTKVAEAAQLSRQSLYRALSRDGDPKISTLFAVLRALGVELRVEKAA